MKNWQNTISVIEVIVIFICVILLIVHFASKTKPQENASNSAVIDQNGLIEEDYAIKYLNKYVDELIFSGYINNNSENYIEKEYYLVTPYFFTDFKNEDKLYLSLSYLHNAQIPLTKDNVERKYNEYFNNTNIEHINVNSCASYSYDQEKELYEEVNECNSDNQDKLMVYKKSYERKGDMALATIYIGIKSLDGIYTDTSKINYYQTDNIANFAINDENYQDFTKYVITFKEKDDALYYFFSIANA